MSFSKVGYSSEPQSEDAELPTVTFRGLKYSSEAGEVSIGSPSRGLFDYVSASEPERGAVRRRSAHSYELERAKNRIDTVSTKYHRPLDTVRHLGLICEDLSESLAYGQARLRSALVATPRVQLADAPPWWDDALQNAQASSVYGRANEETVKSASALIRALAATCPDMLQAPVDDAVSIGVGGRVEVDLLRRNRLRWVIEVPPIAWPGCSVVAAWVQGTTPISVLSRHFFHVTAAVEHAAERYAQTRAHVPEDLRRTSPGT